MVVGHIILKARFLHQRLFTKLLVSFANFIPQEIAVVVEESLIDLVGLPDIV